MYNRSSENQGTNQAAEIQAEAGHHPSTGADDENVRDRVIISTRTGSAHYCVRVRK